MVDVIVVVVEGALIVADIAMIGEVLAWVVVLVVALVVVVVVVEGVVVDGVVVEGMVVFVVLAVEEVGKGETVVLTAVVVKLLIVEGIDEAVAVGIAGRDGDVKLGVVVVAKVVVVLLVVLDVGIILAVVIEVMGIVFRGIMVVVSKSVFSLGVIDVSLVDSVLWREAKGVVIFSEAIVVLMVLWTAEDAVKERVAETELEEWDTYGTPSNFLSSSSLWLLEGLSTYLPEAVCVFAYVCMPCVCIMVPETCVAAIVVSD